jgi:hypothetical protein
VFSVRVRVGSEGAGNGCSVDEASLFGRWIAGHRQAVSRTEGSRRSSMDVALRPLRRRDPDEMVSISPLESNVSIDNKCKNIGLRGQNSEKRLVMPFVKGG